MRANLAGAGYLLGENTEQLQRLLSGAGLVAGLAVIAVYVGYRVLRRKRRAETLGPSR